MSDPRIKYEKNVDFKEYQAMFFNFKKKRFITAFLL